METVDVLVAKGDISLGQSLAEGDMQWQKWPASTTSSSFIVKSSKANAVQDLTGTIARSPFIAGEPIREIKLVRANGSGFMAAILQSGMRAISTEISPETSAGGFILPNDHVDVIMSRKDRQGQRDLNTAQTILTNVRVLAVDQTIGDKDGQKVVVGKTATLELTGSQAETLALARQSGTLTLALRSITDAQKGRSEDDDSDSKANSVNLVRYGVTTKVLTK